MEIKKRLASLDILRGMDLFLLLVAGPIIHKFLEINTSPIWDGVRRQVTHVSWEGFVLWDIIMPLFMFMSGATIPFSMAKYREGERPGKAFHLKLLKRFALLFFLGWIVQGNLLISSSSIRSPIHFRPLRSAMSSRLWHLYISGKKGAGFSAPHVSGCIFSCSSFSVI